MPIHLAAMAGATHRLTFRGEKRSKCHARQHDRSRRHALPQGTGHGSEALLHRHELMENRSVLPVTPGSGACRNMPSDHGPSRSVPTAADFIEELLVRWASGRGQNISRRRSAIDRRTTRHARHAASPRAQERIEETFGRAQNVCDRKASAPPERRRLWGQEPTSGQLTEFVRSGPRGSALHQGPLGARASSACSARA